MPIKATTPAVPAMQSHHGSRSKSSSRSKGSKDDDGGGGGGKTSSRKLGTESDNKQQQPEALGANLSTLSKSTSGEREDIRVRRVSSSSPDLSKLDPESESDLKLKLSLEQDSVVDEKLRVRGIDALRIAGAVAEQLRIYHL